MLICRKPSRSCGRAARSGNDAAPGAASRVQSQALALTSPDDEVAGEERRTGERQQVPLHRLGSEPQAGMPDDGGAGHGEDDPDPFAAARSLVQPDRGERRGEQGVQVDEESRAGNGRQLQRDEEGDEMEGEQDAGGGRDAQHVPCLVQRAEPVVSNTNVKKSAPAVVESDSARCAGSS